MRSHPAEGSSPAPNRGDEASLARVALAERDSPDRSTMRPAGATIPTLAPFLDGAPQVGELLAGRFRIARVLGEGGAGRVFEVRDEHAAATPLALKLLRRASPSAIYRLKREFRVVQGLHHENLVALEGLFHDEGRFFVVMERVLGASFLSGLWEGEGPADYAALRARAAQLVRGLMALHDAGLVHRDIKPSNVLVEPTGRVVIVDFGLAHASHEALSLRERAFFHGTPTYAAPEQLEGAQPSAAADRYALGVILYFALARVAPHAGVSLADLAHQKRSVAPTPPRLFFADTPADLEALCLALLSPDPQLRPDLSRVARVLEAPEPERIELREVKASPPTLSVHSPREPSSLPEQLPLVGRDIELDRLRAAFDRVRGGESVSLFVEGESGLGKTRLVEELLAELGARGHADVLVSRCHPRDTVPFNAIDGLVDALARYLEELDADTLVRCFPSDADALARVFPVLRAFVPLGRASPPATDDAHLRAQAFSQLRGLLVTLGGRRPLAIFLDDIHWGDRDSAHLFRALFHGPESPLALVVGTYRDAERRRSAMLQELFRDAELPADVDVVALQPLAAQSAYTLARVAAGPAAEASLVAALAVRCGGHPLFTIASAMNPQSVGAQNQAGVDSVARALGALSPEARRLLEVICIAGRPLRWDEAAEVSAVRSPRVMRELCGLRLLRERSGERVPLSPYHDRVREAALRSVSEARHAQVHAALGDRLRAGHREARDLERMVEHYRRAGRTQEAAEYALPAARHAMDAAAFERAADLLRFALETLGAAAGTTCQLDHARACRAAGHSDEAANAFVLCAEGAHGDDAFEHRLAAMHLDLQTGRARGHEALRALLREVNLTPSTSLPGRARATWIAARAVLGVLPPLRAQGADAMAARRARVAWAATTGLGAESPAASIYHCCDALVWAAHAGEREVYTQAACALSATRAACVGQPTDAADRWLHQLECEVHSEAVRPRNGSALTEEGSVSLARASYAMHLGRWVEAREGFERALRMPRRDVGLPYSHRLLRLGLLATLTWCGEGARLRQLVGPWLAQAERARDGNQIASFRVFMSHQHLLDDDPCAARAALDAVRAAPLDVPPAARSDVWWWSALELYEGRAEAAFAQCVRAGAEAGAARYATALGRTLWALAEGTAAASCARTNPTARRRLNLEIARLGLEPMRLAGVVAHHLRGLRARVDGDEASAHAALIAASAGYDEVGMRLHAASIDVRIASEPARRERARATFARAGVRDAERFARTVVP